MRHTTITKWFKRCMREMIPICALGLALTITVQAMASHNPSETPQFILPDTTGMEIASSRHTQYEANALSGNKVTCPLTVEGFEKKMETKHLEVWFRDTSDAIRIVDKRSGYIWGSLQEDKAEGLNQMWSSFANSICAIEYFDKNEKVQKAGAGTFGVTSKYKWEDGSMTCTMRLKKEKLSLAFKMEAGDDYLRFSVDDSTIEEEGDAKLKSVYFMPFFGTVREDALDGYVFVPDGPGALIRFQKSMRYNGGFDQKVYGKDMGIDTLEEANDLNSSRTNDYLVEAPQVTMPVYGMVHGPFQNAFLGVLENGEEYASITASPANDLINYTWAAGRFDYRQMYIHPTSKEGMGIERPQENRNDVNAQMSLYFLTGEDADYSGMAVKYRELLKEQGILKDERIDETLPLRMNILGADVKKQFLVNGKALFTRVREAEEIRQWLASMNITNVSMSYEGWQKGGINGADYGETHFDRRLGSYEEAKKLSEALKEQGGRFYLTVNPITANEDQINLSNMAAKTLSRTFAKFIRPNTEILYNERYILKPQSATDALQGWANELSDFSMALDQWGYRLYAEYTREHELTRSETMQLFMEQQKALNDRKDTAVSNPNQYLWAQMDEYFDIPVVNGQYLYETDTVPFLQIVLKGSMDYYAPYANQGFYTSNSILKMVEYGMYPSFVVAASENSDLMDTPQEDLFTVNYKDWEVELKEIYDRLSPVLTATEGREIVQHRMIAEGVARVTYDNGSKLYVNYTSDEYQGEAVVPAQDFILVSQQ